LAQDFFDAYALANADATRSPSTIIAKDTCKRAVIANTRQLAGIIQKFPGTTDEMRSDLGLNIRAAGAIIPPPPNPPVIEVVERDGTTVRLRIHDGTSERRGRPYGVQGTRVYSHVGPTAPDIDGWHLEGQITRPFVDCVFPADTAPGAVVWFTACYYNPRGETGPACAPISTFIAGGSLPMEEAA
jgi:hypothetical protein